MARQKLYFIYILFLFLNKKESGAMASGEKEGQKST